METVWPRCRLSHFPCFTGFRFIGVSAAEGGDVAWYYTIVRDKGLRKRRQQTKGNICKKLLLNGVRCCLYRFVCLWPDSIAVVEGLVKHHWPIWRYICHILSEVTYLFLPEREKTLLKFERKCVFRPACLIRLQTKEGFLFFLRKSSHHPPTSNYALYGREMQGMVFFLFFRQSQLAVLS